MPFTKELEALYNAFRTAGIQCEQNHPMAEHTSFKIGGPAALCAWPSGKGQLVEALSLWRKLGGKCPLCVLGRASNVLFPDEGYRGLVILTTHAKRVVFEEDMAPDRQEFRESNVFCKVYAECGASLIALSTACGSHDRGLSGLEFACGIPGTVGGATVMNAGAYGSDIERIIISAEYYDLSNGRTVTLTDEEMELDYRHSIFLEHPEWIVLSSVFKLSYGYPEDIRLQMEKNTAARKSSQPYKEPSAGSVFKRPARDFAAHMVDVVGMKGVSVGGAQVSTKHAGFIINTGNATAADVIALVRIVRDAVEKVYNCRLQCEIRLISDGIDPTKVSEW